MKIQITKSNSFSTVLVLLLLFFPLLAHGQSKEINFEPIKKVAPQLKIEVKEGSLIFNKDRKQYEESDVELQMRTERSVYTTQNRIVVKGEIKNKNKYPLSDVDIIARVYQNTSQAKRFTDKFLVEKNITLNVNAQRSVEGEWKIPADAQGKTYSINFYVISHDKFNLSGIVPPIRKDAYSSQIQIKVKGEAEEKDIYLDRKKTFIKNKRYQPQKFISQHSSDESLRIKAPLVNSSSKSKNVNITYTLYKRNTQREEHKIQTKQERVTIAPQDKKNLTFTLENPNSPFYVLEVVVKKNDKQLSLVSIPFMIKDVNKPYITNAGLTNLSNEKKINTFVALEGIGDEDIPVNTNLNIIDSRTENDQSSILAGGKLFPNIPYVFENSVKKSTLSGDVKLKVQVKSQDENVETFFLTYSCKTLDALSCTSGFQKDEAGISRWWIFSGIGVFLFFIGGYGIFRFIKHNKQ